MTAQAKTKEPNVVNGINVDDLFSLIEGVRHDATKAKTNWRVSTTWQRQTRSRSQVEGFAIGGEQVSRRFSIDIDEPCELGGSNQFANPQEHLIAALNACMTLATWRSVRCAESPSKAWRSRPTARSISAVSSGPILPCHRATRT
jgi:hypothetical protein